MKTSVFFDNLSTGQDSPVLWIGCSERSIPANQITNTRPSDIFVHRNIINVVTYTDMSFLSVLDYSVNVLKVKHAIACGHYGFGGVKAVLSNKHVGLIYNWLRNIKEVYSAQEQEMIKIADPALVNDRLVKLYAIHDANNIISPSIVQNAWANKQ